MNVFWWMSFKIQQMCKPRFLSYFRQPASALCFWWVILTESIFSFSGASPLIFQRLCQDDRFLCTQCGQIEHPLSQNRRSSQRIIDFLNRRSTMVSGQIPAEQAWVDFDLPVTVLIGGVDRSVDTNDFRSRALQHFFYLIEQNGLNRNQIDSFGVYAYENSIVAALSSVASTPDFQTISAPSSLNQIRSTNRRLYRTVCSLCTALKHKQAGEWSDAHSAVNSDSHTTFMRRLRPSAIMLILPPG